MSTTIKLFCIVAIIGCETAFGHDFWIEPSQHRPQLGQRVEFGLRVGDHFIGERVMRDGRRIEKFISVGPDGERPIPGRDGADPAGVTRFTAPGTHVIGYRSNNAFVELEGPKFEAYLKEKGLDAAARLRREDGRSDTKTREAYSRCAKALVRVGTTDASSGDRVLGFTLELVADSDPCTARVLDELRFRVLFEGKPLAGALVSAVRRDAKSSSHGLRRAEEHAFAEYRESMPPADAAIQERSDSDGVVTLRLEKAGVWMLSCVHMTRAAAGVDAEWQSYWASEFFELRAATVKDGAPPAAALPNADAMRSGG